MAPNARAPLWTVWVALVGIQLGFGAYGVIVAKFAKNEKADPLVFSLIRDGFCFPVLLLAALVAEKKVQVPKFRYGILTLVMINFNTLGCQE